MNYNTSFAEPINFPSDWKTWVPVVTPGVKMGSIPNCNADVSRLPDIYQDMISTYCSLRENGPGKIKVLIRPSALNAFKTKSGKFEDGYNLMWYLSDLKILFATYHIKGKPHYNVFLEDGKKITKETGPLSSKTCQECHSGFKAFCTAGQCGKYLRSE